MTLFDHGTNRHSEPAESVDLTPRGDCITSRNASKPKRGLTGADYLTARIARSCAHSPTPTG